jgi:hypothetical protein
MYIKTDVDGLVKDSNNGAILNVDNVKLEQYRKQKKSNEDRLRDRERINKIENDLSEIKQMLQSLVRDQ